MTDVIVRTIVPHMDAATTERVYELFRRGALTDERLVELYQRNAHFSPSWPAHPPKMIVRHRQRLSSELRLTSVIVGGVHMYAATEYLAAAS